MKKKRNVDFFMQKRLGIDPQAGIDHALIFGVFRLFAPVCFDSASCNGIQQCFGFGKVLRSNIRIDRK